MILFPRVTMNVKFDQELGLFRIFIRCLHAAFKERSIVYILIMDRCYVNMMNLLAVRRISQYPAKNRSGWHIWNGMTRLQSCHNLTEFRHALLLRSQRCYFLFKNPRFTNYIKKLIKGWRVKQVMNKQGDSQPIQLDIHFNDVERKGIVTKERFVRHAARCSPVWPRCFKTSKRKQKGERNQRNENGGKMLFYFWPLMITLYH